MKKTLLILGIFLVLMLGFAGYRGQTWLTRFADQEAETLLAAPFEFSDLSPNFQERSLTLHRVRIFHPDRKTEWIGEIQEMKIKPASFLSLLHGNRALEVVLKNPRFIFTTTRSGDWELANRIPWMRSGKNQAPLTSFNVEKIRVEDGEVEFRDGRVGVTTKLSQISAVLDHFRLPTLQDPFPVEFEARGRLGMEARFETKGKGDFLSPKASFSADLKISGLSLPAYAPYYEAGQPVRVRSGIAVLSGRLQCQGDRLHSPLHASVSGLAVDLKKNKMFEFAADDAVNSLRDKNGNVSMDFLVTGDLRRPQFVVLTDFEGAALGGAPKTLKNVGKKIGEGSKSAWRKVKGVF